jgi:signal transduction histidine kinase/ActR/RegA family two-component response regulator
VTRPSITGTEQTSTALLRWLDEVAAQGVFTTDRALVVRTWNRWLEHHTGIAASDAIGSELMALIPEIGARGLDAHYRAALAGESRVLAYGFHKYLIPGRAGAADAAQTARIGPLSTDNAVVGTVTVVEDVGDRVASERELRSQIEASETARALAEEAVRVKDEFLATLSHEIRTPLNAVVGWTKILLARQVEPAMLTRALQVIDRNAVAQTRLIDDMLDMARIMSGKLRLDMQPIDLSAIVLTAIDVVTPTASAKGVTILTAIDTDSPWLMGDADRLQQIVWNLLSNAIKFTDGGGRVTVGITRELALLMLSVEDTGRGISAEFLPQIFERFRQADSSSSRRHGGLGLGLSLVRQLVELHGGAVSATSQLNAGSRFVVTFPARTELSADEPTQDSAGNLDRLAGVHVLLVEDQDEAREIVTAALEQHGIEVTGASSSREALTALDAALQRGRPPHVIVSDIGLPEEDGYRLMEQLSSRPPSRGGQIPAIAVTAYGRPQDKRRALAAGFRMHITKPIVPESLAAAVAAVLPSEHPR